jgi:hypothetical protein
MPAHDDDHYLCDECVDRGCSCNIDPKTYEQYTDENGDTQFRIGKDSKELTDEQGRLLPCCEYSYEPEGMDLDAPPLTDEEIAALEKEWQTMNQTNREGLEESLDKERDAFLFSREE